MLSTMTFTVNAEGVEPDYKASDYVELGKYKGIELNVLGPVEEEDFEKSIKQQMLAHGFSHDSFSGTVEDGDIVNISFIGKIDGKEFNGGSAENQELRIGSNSFVDGFENGLIGAKVGDTTDVNVTFPDTYSDMAGKEAVFTVTINSKKEPEELNDEIAKELSYGSSDTVDEFTEELWNRLKKNRKTDNDYYISRQIQTKIVENSKIKGYPEDVVDYRIKETTDSYMSIKEQSEDDFKRMLQGHFGIEDEEELPEKIEWEVKYWLDSQMVMLAIAEKEGITVEDDEFYDKAIDYAKTMEIDSVEDLVNEKGYSFIEDQILMDKAIEFIKDNAVLVEFENEEDLKNKS